MKLGREIETSKPIILIIVDTLMDAPLQEAIASGKAPALKFLCETGSYLPQIVAPFPTMSVNVDTTLLTGTYCNEHKIPGLVWFNKNENRLVNYGTHYRELWKLGLSQAIDDLLYNLNESHISREVSTIHEEAEMLGKATASINALVFRGHSEHYFQLPKFLSRFTKLNTKRPVLAPRIFSYGRLSKIHPSNRNQHFWQKAGVNDASSVQQFAHIINTNSLPPFSIVYLPDLDQRIHKKGRMDLIGIQKSDQQIQAILNSFGDWESVLEEVILIVMGDNGQAWVHEKRQQAVIDLRGILRNFQIMRAGKGPFHGDQIVLAVNDRSAYVYSLDLEGAPLRALAKTLYKDKRVEVIAWKDGNDIIAISAGVEGEVRFKRGGTFMDEYGQSWFIKGNGDILNIKMNENQIHYGDFPDVLARLYSSLHSHEGEFLVASARPGYEFAGEGSPVHLGGAGHGGLHAQDSLVPMIVTGTRFLPEHQRIVDLKKWILTLLH
ncbi:alkaline phosphatase family protein [Neobacillus notoginsengisoli]|uniref:Alkaline phosphatase family protein n=1 Tax=Neobacillus notoginsengisoli TaxID=1578198 RepID=A0A417YXH8_9BACI|nr:alkaline phosphatase family protein [Neobacillus notoginsengisoli]RHW42317.1 alkaline phosphatase family protein [Neobacillus notoginsengisoli]